MPIGLTLPFAVSTGSAGYFATTEDKFSAAKTNIRSLMLTNWGERVMHFNMGGNLREFLFEQESTSADDLRGRIADRVIGQISTWLPYLVVSTLNVLFPEDDPTVPQNGFVIKIKFAFTSNPALMDTFDHVVVP